jgi:hypothetical protein
MMGDPAADDFTADRLLSVNVLRLNRPAANFADRLFIFFTPSPFIPL